MELLASLEGQGLWGGQREEEDQEGEGEEKGGGGAFQGGSLWR